MATEELAVIANDVKKTLSAITAYTKLHGIYFQCIRLIAINIWVAPPGWGMICDCINCYIRKCTIYYP